MHLAAARQLALASLLTLGLVAGTGCSKDGGSTSTASGSSSDNAPATVRAPQPVTVLAAASLTEAFGELKTTVARGPEPLDITYSFAGSGALVQQVQQGAPADVIATADPSSMRQLQDADQVEAPKTFARNRLEILVAAGNPKHVKSLADLGRDNLSVVLGAEAVPVGKYAKQVLGRAAVVVKPKSLEPDVKSVVAKVTAGEADASIVYVTDVRAAGSKAEGVEIPQAQNATATYPIAVVKATKHPDAARAFVAAVTGANGQKVLGERGFLPAT